MKMLLDNRLVVDAESEGIDEDTYFTQAFFDDNGEALNEDELDLLGELYPEVLSEDALSRQIMRAEDIFDGER
jgi:hypothetical protein